MLAASMAAMSGSHSATEVPDDGALVRAAQAGDRASFGGLYERYAHMVHGILLARVPAAEADDLTQDVFVKALHRLSTLREIGKFGGWLAAIARNLANDYHREAVREEVLAEDLPDQDSAGGTRLGELDAAGVLDAIRSLPDAYRETLILRLVEGMTGPEIAARTGLTPGSVRVNLHRGMQMLRERLDQKSPLVRKAGRSGAPSSSQGETR